MKLKKSAKVFTPSFEAESYPRARISFLAIANAGIIENDMFSMKPDDIFLHFTRIPMQTEVNISNLSGMEHELESSLRSIMPGRDDVDVICYNCTSGSFVIGEEKIKNKIEAVGSNVIGTTMVSGVDAALKALNVKRIVIGTAYTPDINELERQYFIDKGFEVLNIQGLSLLTDAEMNNVTPNSLIDYAISLDSPEADAIFLSCGALRSTEVISEIESIVKKPVITSNQASFWNCLRLAGINDQVQGYGQLLEHY